MRRDVILLPMMRRGVPKQDIFFVSAKDGARIACASSGRGPTIVRAAHWLTHISRDLDSPVWQHWLAELTGFGRLVRYDLRGCGLSSRNISEISFEAWLSDLEAVTEAIDEPFTLIGMSQGAALSIAYALRHPDKVERLVLIGGYARGLLARDTSDRARLEAATLTNLMRLGWGRDDTAFNQVFTHLFIPDGTLAQHKWWRSLEQDTASADIAARTMETLHRIDVLNLAAQLKVPTLVLHANGDARVPFAQGRELAMTIPDAKFVPLDSNNHVLLDTEPAWNVLLSSLRDFLGTSDDLAVSDTDFGLTTAEEQVLTLVAKGLSNSEIAELLDKSEKTVRNQVSSLFDKVGVQTRSVLIVRVLSAHTGQTP
ncbi:alpha/beta fold hydrolase [Roseibium sp.]|uniref:alpha/beta fold hydrolase n=1 Tax=Roseibium sp. TaxID=1936156 RepID=UPI003512AEFB